MAKLEKFEIILSRENLIYSPEEEVSGNLIIKAKDRNSHQCILVRTKF